MNKFVAYPGFAMRNGKMKKIFASLPKARKMPASRQIDERREACERDMDSSRGP
jgi:hypothetical protein